MCWSPKDWPNNGKVTAGIGAKAVQAQDDFDRCAPCVHAETQRVQGRGAMQAMQAIRLSALPAGLSAITWAVHMIGEVAGVWGLLHLSP
jgi:hypothetical protein